LSLIIFFTRYVKGIIRTIFLDQTDHFPV